MTRRCEPKAPCAHARSLAPTQPQVRGGAKPRISRLQCQGRLQLPKDGGSVSAKALNACDYSLMTTDVGVRGGARLSDIHPEFSTLKPAHLGRD